MPKSMSGVIIKKQGKKDGTDRRTDKTVHSSSTIGTYSGLYPATWPALFANYTHTEEIPDAGIRAGEIIGHRCWYVHLLDGVREIPRLCSTAHFNLWIPGDIQTGKVNELADKDMLIPGGVYAWSSKGRALEHLMTLLERVNSVRSMSEAMGDYGQVFKTDWEPAFETYAIAQGTVKMWGEIIEHRSGYRASHAKVHSLVGVTVYGGPPYEGSLLKDLQKLYGVKVHPDYDFPDWMNKE